jgi:alpha-tubulin suppressor-like RCC1 family protein
MCPSRRWALLVVVALAGCQGTVPSTQVLVHFDAEPATRARAEAIRFRVWGGDGAIKLDQTLVLGEGDPVVELPLTLPLVPRAQDASRTFAVVADLLEGDDAFNTQRLVGGYVPSALVHVYVTFEDACIDAPACGGESTCSGGACATACRSPTAETCPRESTPCGECTERGDAGCVPVAEGTACGGGTCRLGACCMGCWDGTECQPGDGPQACGIAGSGCFACRCPEHACVAGACAIPATAVTVVAGGHTSCAIAPDARLGCWGDNDGSVLATGDLDDRNDPVLVGSERWEQIAIGWAHACAIADGGALFCWGENDTGEAGIGEVTMEPVPAPVPIGADPWKGVGAGDNHSCAIRDDGSLWCWGLNNAGQLGQGDLLDLAAPTRVATDTDWIAVDGGDAFSCALRADASMWCWGGNAWGQVGRGNTNRATAPVKISGTRAFTTVAVGGYHACALADDGSLWCWGRNSSGQAAGPIAEERVLAPARIGMDADWTMLAAGDLHTCAIEVDGTLWCWGENGNGQLGQGNTADLAVPTQVGTDTHWTAVTAGARHTCALRDDGTVRCFGRNDMGQLGTRNNSNYRRPAPTCLPP